MEILVIDPKEKSIKREKRDDISLQDYYDIIGCSMVQVVPLDYDGKYCSLWCDEEALMKAGFRAKGCFQLEGVFGPTYGKGVITQEDEDGEYKDIELTIDEFEKHLQWGGDR